MRRETVVVLDFGGQYNQLIARRVRECNVYCEIYSYKTDIEKIKEIKRELFLQEDQTAVMSRMLLLTQKKSLNWVFRYLESATVLSL